ncbi:MAG TPA: T9SS type A sorting domain-containing protein [Puia sp.]|nr:T9SS type A sorting domain-containing protein [Puia sp.]
MKTILLFIALVIATTYSHAGITSNGDPIGGNIVLTNFEGLFSENQDVDLSWSTMMESNVEYFEIQRSGDGMNFEDIDSVQSQMKISTNVYQLQYKYTDTHPLTGTSYYKVKVVGKNGYINQSPVVQIINIPSVGTRIYPTLIQNNMVFVESDKNLKSAKLEFFDLSGRKISETYWEYLNVRQNVQVSKSGILPTGTYIARLTSNGQNIKNQVVIVQSH